MSIRTGVWAGAALSLLLAGAAQAALLERLDGQAYYDTELDITWLADANLAASNSFDVAGVGSNGLMSFRVANDWIAALNEANYLGYDDWRLPTMAFDDRTSCDWGFGGTNCGLNVDVTTGELAHMYYSTLGNVAAYDSEGNLSDDPCDTAPNSCLANTGPFSNLEPERYWTDTIYADENFIWGFDFKDGDQGFFWRTDPQAVWAVRAGDVGVIPVPGALWLLGSALGVLGLARRRSMPIV